MVVILEKAVFVHVPKAAGSSIASALGGTTNTRVWPMHVPFRCLEHLGKPGFGFIRNPWDYMVSLHWFLRRSPDRHRQRVQRETVAALGFKRWLMEAENWTSNEPIDGDIWIAKNQKYLPVGPNNTYPGIERLYHPTLGLPPQQRRPQMWYLEGCKWIGKVEDLPTSLFGITASAGIGRPNLKHINKTPARPKDYREAYDSETKAFVAEHFAWDIKQGGYSFDGDQE